MIRIIYTNSELIVTRNWWLLYLVSDLYMYIVEMLKHSGPRNELICIYVFGLFAAVFFQSGRIAIRQHVNLLQMTKAAKRGVPVWMSRGAGGYEFWRQGSEGGVRGGGGVVKSTIIFLARGICCRIAGGTCWGKRSRGPWGHVSRLCLMLYELFQTRENILYWCNRGVGLLGPSPQS